MGHLYTEYTLGKTESTLTFAAACIDLDSTRYNGLITLVIKTPYFGVLNARSVL